MPAQFNNTAKYAVLFVLLALAPAAAHAEATVALFVGTGESDTGLIQSDKLLFGVAAKTETYFKGLNLLIAGGYGTGTGPAGPIDFGFAQLSLEFELGDYFRLRGGYQSGTALLADLDNELLLVARAHGWIVGAAVVWDEDKPFSREVSFHYAFKGKPKSSESGGGLCGRWGPVQGCMDWISREAPFPDGEAWSLVLFIPLSRSK